MPPTTKTEPKAQAFAPVLETERLVLRPLLPHDLGDMYLVLGEKREQPS